MVVKIKKKTKAKARAKKKYVHLHKCFTGCTYKIDGVINNGRNIFFNIRLIGEHKINPKKFYVFDLDGEETVTRFYLFDIRPRIKERFDVFTELAVAAKIMKIKYIDKDE